jgi:hypothetical protein
MDEALGEHETPLYEGVVSFNRRRIVFGDFDGAEFGTPVSSSFFDMLRGYL